MVASEHMFLKVPFCCFGLFTECYGLLPIFAFVFLSDFVHFRFGHIFPVQTAVYIS